MMCKKTWLMLASGLVVLCGGGVVAAWSMGWFDTGVHTVSMGETATSESVAGNLTEALSLATTAQTKLNQMPGYRCVYLRDEFIGKDLQKNSLILTVLHEPFSVMMEWVEPKSKEGRKAMYVTGKNDGKMRVKIGFLKLSLDLQESISQKESRHTLVEAGMKPLMDRFVKSWEEESKAGETNARYSDVNLTPEVSGKKYAYSCRCVETDHPAAAKSKYPFHRVKVYFDKTTGLPVRMEGYDWPGDGQKEGQLVEQYSYFDVKPSPTPTLGQFEL